MGSDSSSSVVGEPSLPAAGSELRRADPGAEPPSLAPALSAQPPPSLPHQPNTEADWSRRRRDDFAVALYEHEREPRSAWGRRAEGSIARDLEALVARIHARVLHVDCRSSTCAARLLFDDRAAAAAGFPEILQARYQEDCSVEVVLDDPTARDPSRPWETTALFRCGAR
jgi:hypothetical protein